jgi:hypothetical protein
MIKVVSTKLVAFLVESNASENSYSAPETFLVAPEKQNSVNLSQLLGYATASQRYFPG